MVSQETGIPGLFSSDLHNQSGSSSAPSLFSNSTTGVNSSESTSAGGDLFIHLRGSALIVELNNEKENLDSTFVHSKRLIDEEIARLQRGGAEPADSDPDSKLSEKVYIPYETQRQFNLVGRLLGPKGLTLKRMQAETQTKMSIMGRGCMRDKKKEEELRDSDDPTHLHLKDDLHVLVQSEPPYSSSKLAAGVAEVKKMLIPLEPGQPDMIAAKYLEAGIDGFPAPSLPPPSMDPPRNRGPGGRGGSRGGGMSPGGRGGGRGGMRGGRGGGGGGRVPSRGGGSGGVRRGGGAGGRGRGGSGRGPPQGGYGGREGAGRMLPRGQEMGGYGGADDMKSHMDYESNHGFHTERSWRDEPPYDRRGGGGRSPRDLGDRPGMGRGDSYSSMDSDPYYSNFSDGPQSRDYRHGLGSAGASDWKAPRPGKKDYRHHPYQSPGGYY